MRIGLEQANLGELVELWRSFYPAKYHVSADVFRQNTLDSSVTDWGASGVHVLNDKIVGFVVVKRSGSPTLWSGSDPEQTHLCAIAFTEPVIGVEVMADVRRTLRDRGTYRLVFGQDSRHFFPGVPAECTQLAQFLMIEGFQPGEKAVDVEHDLTNYEPPTSWREKLGSEAVVRACTEADMPALDEFFRREFPRRWMHDVLDKIRGEEDPGIVYGLFADGHCEGFAITQSDGCRMPIAGAVWHLDLGEKWGALGPIGVSERVRGRGWGGSLLAGALVGLKEKGARRCIIDWTTLVDFYGKHGFTVAREYTPMTLDLAE